MASVRVPDQAIIEAEDVANRFGETQALDSVSLACPGGGV
jgi:ABC-type sugar transport system ATPase subunit